MADCEFTAVTLGPLYDTFQLTSTPGGTWCASYLFSWLAREIITNLVNDDIPKKNFIAPVFEVKEDGTVFVPKGEDVAAKGVGLFFDHIIVEGDVIAEATAARDKALATLADKIAEAIGEDKKATEEWVRQYFRIYIVKKNIPLKKGVIAAFGDVLSTLEYEPHYALQEDNNLLLKLFENVDASGQVVARNECLKLFSQNISDDWMLKNPTANTKIRDIKSIADPKAQGKPSWKSEEYYCILNSDGDSMGKFFADCAASDAARELSQKSLQYCIQAAEMVLKYKGVPLYAGGDDLLAIVPVTGFDPDHEEQEITVFELINKLNTRFNLIFSEERQNNPGKPSISVGLSIQHIKSPLYEGLNRAFDLLHAAKNSSPRKNGLCVDLQKHSGQSFRFTVRVMSDSELVGSVEGVEDKDCMTLIKLDKMIKNAREACRAEAPSAEGTATDATEDLSVFLSGAGYALEKFAPLFAIALSQFMKAGCTGNSLRDFFRNMYDNAGQEKYKSYLTSLCEYCELSVKKDAALIRTLLEDAAKSLPITADYSAAEEILIQSVRYVTNQAEKRKELKEFILKILGYREDWERKQKDQAEELTEAIMNTCLNTARHCSDSIRVLKFMTELPGKGIRAK